MILTLNFQGQTLSKGISGEASQICVKQKQCDPYFDPENSTEHGFSRSNLEITGIGGPIDIKQGDVILSFMTTTMAFWWPKWGGRIY